MTRSLAMGHSTDGRPISAGLFWLILAIWAVGLPSSVHAQPEIPVQDIEDLNALTRLRVTLQLVLVPEALADVNPLYAYNAVDLAGAEIYPDRIGGVATVHRCSSNSDHDEAWCARYFPDIQQAFDAAYGAASGPGDGPGSQDVYFATTYPLANIPHQRRFVSGLSP